MNPRAQRAIDRVIRLEGGYVNDPHDAGGATKYGISSKSYPHLVIRSLTQAQAAEIYHQDWWLRYRYGEINSDEIAFRMLDMAVVAGPKAAGKCLQKAINKVSNSMLAVDGQVGRMTIESVNVLTTSGDQEAELIRVFQKKRIEYFESLNQSRFLKGWINRVNALVEG